MRRRSILSTILLSGKKLLNGNIDGKIFRVVFDMYKKAKSCVRVGNEFSRMFACHIGVRQGENLSPLLFAIFLNDLVGYMSQRFKGLNLISDDID